MIGIWQSLIPALISGVIAAALVPFVQQRFVWRPQKRIEFQRAAFNEALTALAMREADAYSPSLQSKAATVDGLRRAVENRDETAVQMQRATYLVQGFFPAGTAAAFEKAVNYPISIKTIPNTEYGELVRSVVKMMAEDIGLRNPTGPLFGPPRAK